MNGNITSNGITADLEAMQRAGIGGVLLMEIDAGNPPGQVAFGSTEWLALFRHVCSEAGRLGLELRMNNDAGFCGSGGPWITPELSMQKVVWTEISTNGPCPVKATLPQPQTLENYYRDIAVLAVPTPASDGTRMLDAHPKLLSSNRAPDSELERLVDGDTNTTLALPQPGPGEPSFITLEFPQPYRARQLVLRMPISGDQIVHGWLQASDDGQTFRDIREFDVIPSTQVFNFPETKARFFRISFPTKNADVDQFVLSELELSPRCRIEGIEAKALFVRKISYPGPSQFPGQSHYPEPPANETIDPARRIDLSGRVGTDGVLRWDAPPGRWTIIRFGHTSTGKKNHPAPDAGCGLECDKLSRAGSEAAFNGLMGKLAPQAAAVAPGVLLSTHIDSWEVGSQNWTAEFAKSFRKARGYDLIKWLPVLTGRVVGTMEESERFLWDFRETISSLLVNNYAGHMRDLAHEHGLRLSIEAYDGPCDDLTYAGRADEPMAEFWTIPAFEMAPTCTEMSSAAHLYGRPIIGAEAFTENMADTWLGHPYTIKTFGDWAFCEGINRFVVHCYTHQPWTDPTRFPGMLFAQVGLHYQRTQTWWDWSRPWNEYLARCQYLLRQGLPVADICYLAPEMAPRHWYNPDRSGERGGYNFDCCPAEVLLERISVHNGRLTLPDGMSYRVLALPDSQTMTPRLLGKIRQLLNAGATVVGLPPEKSPSLSEFPRCDERLQKLVREIWGTPKNGSSKERRVGKGRIIVGRTPQAVLEADGVPPDFLARGKSAPAPFHYTHRSLAEGELYFVANMGLQTEDAVCAFRVAHSRPELWHAETGEIGLPGVYDSGEKTTRMPLRLGPAGSVFVFFRKRTDPKPQSIQTVFRNGAPLLETTLPPAVTTPVLPDVTNNFTYAVWVKPETATTLPKEAVFGKSEYWHPRNDVLYPPHGHYIYHSPDHAFSGLAVGTNGVCATEVSADYWGTPLVYRTSITNWTHVTIVYREGQPSLYLNGQFVRTGLRSTFRVHCGVAVKQMRGSPPFVGELGNFFHAHKPFTSEEVAQLARSMPTPLDPPAYVPIAITESTNGLAFEVTEPGRYTLETAGEAGRTPSDSQASDPSMIRTNLSFPAEDFPPPFTINGPWGITFPDGWGAPGSIVLENLISWKDHPDPGVKHFSGTATYTKTFSVPDAYFAEKQRLTLDLGKVAIMARVTLNGKTFEPLWLPPFRLDVTHLLKPENNHLEIQVVNTWVNRMVGDELLPEDSERNPDGQLKAWPEWLVRHQPSPAGRFTFSSYQLWKADTPLQDSGLLGPVRIVAARRPTAIPSLRPER